MKPILKNSIAVVAGILLGNIVNMGIIMISGSIIPPPPGTDIITMEGLQKALPLFKPINFLMPFLAHALGTFAGAMITVIIAASHKMKLALLIGLVFLAGGIMNIVVLPSPTWFTIVDLVFAYLPMGYLAAVIFSKKDKA